MISLSILRYCRSKIKRRNFLSQRKYIANLLEENGLVGAKSTDASIDMNVKFDKDDGQLFENLRRYQCLFGKLIYLTMT